MTRICLGILVTSLSFVAFGCGDSGLPGTGQGRQGSPPSGTKDSESGSAANRMTRSQFIKKMNEVKVRE
jgi:hypothetical protein